MRPLSSPPYSGAMTWLDMLSTLAPQQAQGTGATLACSPQTTGLTTGIRHTAAPQHVHIEGMNRETDNRYVGALGERAGPKDREETLSHVPQTLPAGS